MSPIFLRFAAVAVIATAAAVPAFAHPKLITSTPAPNSAVKATSSVALHFSEGLVAQFSGIEITMTDMPGMKMTAPMAIATAKTSVGPDGKTLMVALKTPLTTGSYTLAWHVVSTDTHRVAGKYNFKVS